MQNMSLTVGRTTDNMLFQTSNLVKGVQTLQELQMLPSVTLNCQVTKIVMHSGSQLSEL